MASTDSHKLGKEDGNFILPERTFGQGHSEEPTFFMAAPNEPTRFRIRRIKEK